MIIFGSSFAGRKPETDGRTQYGGSPVKVGEEEYHLFRDHE